MKCSMSWLATISTSARLDRAAAIPQFTECGRCIGPFSCADYMRNSEFTATDDAPYVWIEIKFISDYEPTGAAPCTRSALLDPNGNIHED